MHMDGRMMHDGEKKIFYKGSAEMSEEADYNLNISLSREEPLTYWTIFL